MSQFQDNSSEALNLLSNQLQLKQMTSQSASFLRKLAEHPFLLKDMLDIGLRPTYFQKEKGYALTTDLPALAIDALVNLYEEFIDLLATDKLLKKDRSLDGFEFEDQQQQHEIKSQQEVQAKQQFKLLTYIHLCIIQNQPQDTAYSYLTRLIGPLSYQRPTQLMRFYETKPEIIASIIERMSHRGIVELFCKILECEFGKQFFKEYKCKYMGWYLQRVKKALGSSEQLAWLEGLHQTYRFLTEKMEDKVDQNKYISLLQTLRDYQLQLLLQINHKINQGNAQALLFCLRWIEEILKHDSYIMGQSNVRLNITIMNRKNSVSSNFYGDQKVQHKNNYHISESHLKEILVLCQKIAQSLVNSNKNASMGQILISFYRVLYFFIRIWVHKSKEKQTTNPHLLTTLINENFMDMTFNAVLAHPRNTSFHNCVKQVIIECIRERVIGTIYFYKLQGGYCKLFMASYPKTNLNMGAPFSQQLYHIYKEVVIANPHVSNPIENILLTHTQRTNKLIGYDPRKLHEDNLRGSSNAFSQSSENVEDILEFDLHSSNSVHGVGSSKSLSSIIKIHNSPSIQRCELQEVGEQRIVIQGMQEDD